MITGAQSRMGRAALGWTTRDLAKEAKVGLSTVLRFESERFAITLANRLAIQHALEAAGIEFIPPTQHGPGAQLKIPSSEAAPSGRSQLQRRSHSKG